MKELSTKSFDNELTKLLTDDQKTDLATITDKERQTKIDSTALKSLAKLQTAIEFQEGQRDEVYKILTAAAEKKILAESQQPDLLGLQLNGFDIDMDPYDLGLMQAMTELQASPGQPAKTMQEIVDERIKSKVDELRPVLNADQLEQYRAELKSKGPGLLGDALMSSGKIGVGSISTSAVVTPDRGNAPPPSDKQ